MTPTGPTLETLAGDLAAGRTSAKALIDDCLARIADPVGEGARAFVHVDEAAARTIADGMDRLRSVGAAPSRFAGIPLATKDLFNVAGEVTRAGSVLLRGNLPATEDAAAVARLRRAGFVLVGRTNMTEFAFSGLGLNPRFGTPLAPWRRDIGYAPGGSTSGGAVAVADGMAHAALGSDTGGSCRIPAAFTGLVGWKPTARRVSCKGILPLSPSLDSVGVIARSVACCATLDTLLTDGPSQIPPYLSVEGLRLLISKGLPLEDLDRDVAAAFEAALSHLSASGAILSELDFPEFYEIVKINAAGGFPAAESYAWHRQLLREHADDYDPRVASRIRRGEAIAAADYLDMIAARTTLIARATARLCHYDALVMPTVPIGPPRLEELEDDIEYYRLNSLVLRNPTIVNMIDGCAISLPIRPHGTLPVGLMLAGSGGNDAHLLALAAAIEACLSERKLRW